MSTDTTTALAPDDAYALLHQQVYMPVFFEKLANDYNIVPGSEEEMGLMLDTAETLRRYHDENQTKQASAQTRLLESARNDLQQQLGYPAQQKQAADQRRITAAATASYDPAIAHATLSMFAAQ